MMGCIFVLALYDLIRYNRKTPDVQGLSVNEKRSHTLVTFAGIITDACIGQTGDLLLVMPPSCINDGCSLLFLLPCPYPSWPALPCPLLLCPTKPSLPLPCSPHPLLFYIFILIPSCPLSFYYIFKPSFL